MGVVLMVDPWAKNVDFSGGAAFELRGGLAPPQPSEPVEPALWINVAPSAQVTYQDRVRGRQVSLTYSPQLYLRLSERIAELSQLPPGRPLQFHRATLRYAGELSQRWSWQGSAGGSIGEQDYSLQSGGLVQGDGSDPGTDIQTVQSGLVNDPIIRTAGFSGGVAATVQLTPLHSLSFGPAVTVQRLIGEIETAEGQPPPSFDQTSVEMSASHTWQGSRVDALATTVTGGYADFGPTNGTQAYLSGALAWRRRLRPRLDSELSAGVFYTQQLSQPDESSATQGQGSLAVPVMPIGNAAIIGRVLERARLRITTDINAGSQAYFDPVQGSVLPLAGGGVGVTFAFPPDLTAGVVATFYTPPTRPSEQERRLAGDPAAARTILSVRTPVTYIIDENAAIEVGTIVTARGPNLRSGIPDPDQEYSFIPDGDGNPTMERYTLETVPFGEIEFVPWRFAQTEFWIYVSVALDYTTRRSP